VSRGSGHPGRRRTCVAPGSADNCSGEFGLEKEKSKKAGHLWAWRLTRRLTLFQALAQLIVCQLELSCLNGGRMVLVDRINEAGECLLQPLEATVDVLVHCERRVDRGPRLASAVFCCLEALDAKKHTGWRAGARRLYASGSPVT
jgi:hypothetical protein